MTMARGNLIVVTETICYLGWLYPFSTWWLASELFATTREGGWLLLANSMYEDGDPLLSPVLTRTYRSSSETSAISLRPRRSSGDEA